MMGVTHVTSGLLAGLVSAPTLAQDASPAGRAVWILTVAGAALLPDLDTPTSTAGRMWGPVSQTIARGIGTLAGGHRWGTHDLILAPAIIWIGATAAYATRAGTLLLMAVTASLILAGIGSVGLGRLGALGNLATATAAAWWHSSALTPHDLALLPTALAVGAAVHIAGDALTAGKIPIPILWLRRRQRVGLPLLRTGGLVEGCLITPGLTVLTLWALWTTTSGAALTAHARGLLLGVMS
jgi:hypothetical protein